MFTKSCAPKASVSSWLSRNPPSSACSATASGHRCRMERIVALSRSRSSTRHIPARVSEQPWWMPFSGLMEAQGWAEVSVSTMPDNERAIAFYRSLGFAGEAGLLERHRQG